MKAITCTQCGALIKRISRRDDFALCDYCGAKMLVEENKTPVVETSDKPENAAEKPLAPWDQYRENRRKVEERARQYDHLDNYAEETGSKHYPAIGALVIIGIAGILTFIFALSSNTCQSRLANLKEKTPVKTVASPEIKYSPPTPVPQVNYEVKVQWDGNNDLEHFENPQIDMSKLPTSNVAELKKTVFKNRGVQVKVTIGTTGEVTSAEAISGNPILSAAAVEAAKKSLFNSRSKPTSRILTYYFRLTDD